MPAREAEFPARRAFVSGRVATARGLQICGNEERQ